jgi:hypothetical protein
MLARRASFLGLITSFVVSAAACGGAPATGSGSASSASGGSGPGSGGAGTSAGGAGGTVSTSSMGTTGATSGTASTGATGGSTSGTGGSGCATDTADCNKNASDGCEVNTASDTGNCGSCGHVCQGGPGSAAVCLGGNCALTCAVGSADCNKAPGDGCEVNTKNDPKNCGNCGIDCGANACVQGACACASQSQTAKPVQLDLFIMMDQSGSMSDAVAGGGTKWSTVTTALNGFFADPANAGLGVGIQFFGLPASGQVPGFCTTDADCLGFGPCFFFQCLGGGGSGDSCVASDYAVPDVEIAPLAVAQTNALIQSVNAHSPTTNTPTAPALQGAIQHAQTWGAAHPTHTVAVVFATDGDPTECNPQDIPSIANIAAAGANAGIKTFVIGVGPSLGSLNQLAVGGGTGSAFIVDTNANVVQQFEAALTSIQKNALGCEYTIPQPAMGMLDFGKINVQYTPGVPPSQVLPNVPDAASCTNAGGWYYDNNAAPTKILFCPSTCTSVKADPAGKVDILLGCDTAHM